MIQINPTNVANRIGRITLATALAGILMMIVSVPFRAAGGELPSILSPIGLVTTTLTESMLMVFGATLFAPPAILVLWALERRYPRLTAWKVLAGIAAIMTVAIVALGTSNTPLEYVSSAISTTGYALAVLLSIAVSESLFAGQLADDVSPRQLATGYGSVVIALAALVMIGAVGAGAAGIVSETAGLDSSDQELEGQLSHEQFHDEYGHLTAINDPDMLVCGTGNTSSLSDRPAAAHHEGNLSEWDVNVTIEETFSEAYLEATFEHDTAYEIDEIRTSRPTTDEISIGSGRTSWEGDTASITLTNSKYAIENPNLIDETTLELDVLTDDGEIERYTATLCTGE